MSDIRTKVHEILAAQALIEPKDVRDDMTLADLGIDSMGVVEAIFAIEEGLNIQVPFNANEPEKSDFDISSVAAIVRAVEGLVTRQAA